MQLPRRLGPVRVVVLALEVVYGDTLSLALPAGDYEIALLAEDPTYLFEVEEKRYTRACQ